MNVLTRVVAVASLSVALISCSKSSGSQGDVFELKESAAAASQSMSSQVAPPAPEGAADMVVSAEWLGPSSTQNLIDFSWKDKSGKVHKLSEESKGKVVIVNFWATWCPPCRREIPEFIKFAESNKDVYIVGIACERGDVSTAKSNVTTFAEKNGMNYINVTGTEALGIDKFTSSYMNIAPMDAIPVTIIFNKAGVHVSTIIGSTNTERLNEDVTKARS